MKNYDVALRELLAGMKLDRAVHRVTLAEAYGRKLAQDVVANYDTPQFDNSAMDGYALCDFSGGRSEFKIVERIMAGDDVHFSLQEGEAARIFTGAKTPGNTTTVVMQELTKVEGDQLYLTEDCPKGQNIRYCGEEIKKGEILFHAGHVLDPAAIALLASQGVWEIEVYQDLRVTIFSTGNELKEPWENITGSEIYDANRYQLLAWVSSLAKAKDGGILKDEYASVLAALSSAAKENDLIILSGGASVGEADFVAKAITELGELHMWKLAIKPGKPFGWGRIGQCHIIMLPGNPVSAYATFYLLAYPAIKALMGLSPQLPQLMATINFGSDRIQPRREFLRGNYYQDERGEYFVDSVGLQGSAMLSGLSYANCLIEMKENQATAKGSRVRIYPLPKEVAKA
ncbi:gephyrin-like molybdotransferase Glp [Ignatzschineria cameli]|uniref:Molybdopterin molybdenumtransferase n=1 Tax=Ignatzschineria cameli TaxID=2182793 RepID=A0A2U2AR35_9GAMM|nr:gephyrin-like molybdotransferase Glp [Ignatzschineria cameli]PWD85252.1 molybdopterin molybdenumtransferase MoeA [Ignatzschineria cameli]PWD86323.1 molybdopterin molybdenumtransferase MoeA [Ignatzschineria cameli]PWD89839.1 molybdopterin molybdenumtransferase MoeA [Ignatzschineria cameli]PWD91489.1 molybdopterin molybdenumtransferase MoeA [Ignatzschineria cameli]PWD92527.1 molybdopterin molybdenumtransferase MoeA [Ignatzschineria cameli]